MWMSKRRRKETCTLLFTNCVTARAPCCSPNPKHPARSSCQAVWEPCWTPGLRAAPAPGSRATCSKLCWAPHSHAARDAASGKHPHRPQGCPQQGWAPQGLSPQGCTHKAIPTRLSPSRAVPIRVSPQGCPRKAVPSRTVPTRLSPAGLSLLPGAALAQGGTARQEPLKLRSQSWQATRDVTESGVTMASDLLMFIGNE